MNSEMNEFCPGKARFCFLKALAVGSVAIFLGAAAAESSPQSKESSDGSEPQFLSPDGKYGLLLGKEDRVELIEVATKRSLKLLSDPDSPEIPSKARLDWSKDSRMVAAYTATKVDGYTRILAREGDGFVEVKLPKLPALPNPEQPSAEFRKKHSFKFLKWIDAGSIEFVRWLDSGDLLMRSVNEVATADGKVFRAEVNATIAIDAKHHATLKKADRKESLE
jgi:hypothetical protein